MRRKFFTEFPMSDALVQVSNLTRFYQNQRAVNQLSFTLHAGEVLGFLGPNGAGKSTTMQMITGNLAPSEGEISIAGYDLIEAPLEARQHIGYLPEHPPVYQDSKVDEYLSFCARLHRLSSQQAEEAVARVKQQCGLMDMGQRLIGNLSKGYQQRVGIAQAIIHNPSVVILDEPTVGLDPIQIREIRDLIRNIGKERSVILSTHILPEVQATCDRVQIIRAGELIYHSSIDALNDNREQSIKVAVQRPPALSELQTIDGVDDAVIIEEGHFRLVCTADAVNQLVTLSVEKNWGLYELVPEQQSLEALFIELTMDEAE